MAVKRCLVFGGSGALGSAICKTLYSYDCSIAFTYYNNRESADSLAKSVPGAAGIRCNLGDVREVHSAVGSATEILGGLDALIVAAGTSGDERLWKCAAPGNYDKLNQIRQDDFDEMMAINVRGPFAACQAAAPRLRESGGGNILMVRSIDGIKPVPSPVHFASSTAAVKGMMESMSKELGNYNIRVNLVAVGILEEGASRHLSHEVTDAYLQHCSLRRFGKASEIAEVVAWLAVSNTYLTGQTLILDGGL
jgi:NAD(P)-dependent dehydrogenase (short-subunit alcohol dehydrogenase family)